MVTPGVDASSRPTRELGPNAAQQGHPGGQRGEAGQEREQGRHGRDPWPQAAKGPKEPTRQRGR